MKLCQFALGVVAFAVSASSLAGTVTTSSNLEFLAINGQKASKSLLKEKNHSMLKLTKHNRLWYV
ncbi:conserved domain protein [Haemophilus parainfluenzae ATCC 33392]|nr:conserved domain protein [Haemophilus parainfluenzae ATCC 33392]